MCHVWTRIFIIRKEGGFMSDKKMFMSSLAPFFKEYVAPRYLKGTCPSIIINALRSLDRFLVSSGYDKDYLLQDEYDKWAKTLANLSPMTIYTYKCSLINFLQFMNRIGHESFVPIRPKYPASDFVPYIFSHAEMERIFKCLDGMRVRPKRSTTVLMVMPAIIRMLYSTGIRIGEALTLRNRDVDFKRRILILNDTKNNCQRFAPINKSLEGVLKRYVKYRDKMPVKGAKSLDGFFFISYRGKPISHGNVYDTFIKVLKAAGIERMSNHKGPNLHSIRHTACMHALKKLVDSGVDMYCGLPILSAFMGHKNVYDTESYIHLSAEYYPDILDKVSGIDEGIRNIMAKAIINK